MVTENLGGNVALAEVSPDEQSVLNRAEDLRKQQTASTPETRALGAHAVLLASLSDCCLLWACLHDPCLDFACIDALVGILLDEQDAKVVESLGLVEVKWHFPTCKRGRLHVASEPPSALRLVTDLQILLACLQGASRVGGLGALPWGPWPRQLS